MRISVDTAALCCTCVPPLLLGVKGTSSVLPPIRELLWLMTASHGQLNKINSAISANQETPETPGPGASGVTGS